MSKELLHVDLSELDCGTTACIAGHIWRIAGKPDEPDKQKAALLAVQAMDLFEEKWGDQ